MKKFIFASVIALGTTLASAGDVGVSVVRDFNIGKNGLRAEGQLLGLTVSGTNIDGVYNRLAVGKQVDLLSVGPVKFGAGAAAVYHARLGAGEDGYGATLGAKASYKLNNFASLTAGVEQFYGQRRLRDTSGVVGTVGLQVSF